MILRELIKVLDCPALKSDIASIDISGVACNSRLVGKDFIFVAIKGTRENGEAFIDEAIKKGAKVIITQSAQRITRNAKRTAQDGVIFIKVKDARKSLAKLAVQFYGNPSAEIKVVGVTGTNGKTTITYLLESLLREAGFSPAVIGTVNYRYNGKIFESKNTTPGPLEIQAMLADMRDSDVDYLAMEVSSHALDQNRIEGVNFHSAIFTNLTQDHLDYHKTKESYFKAKVKLFTGLSKNSFAVINNDDSYGRRLLTKTHAEKLTYGIKAKADFFAQDIEFGLAKTAFRLSSPRGGIDITTNLIGYHNVYNVLALCAWGVREGFNLELIRSALNKFNFVPGRLERVDSAKDFSVFVDYAHTEDALKNVISTLKHLKHNRIIVVFGCGGDRDKGKRPKMGRVVSNLADYAIITNDNPRSEDPLEIIRDITRGIKKRNYSVVPDRLEAIKESIAIAQAGDIILLAGKGHEAYQIIKNKVFPFDDRKAAQACLN